MFKGIFSNLPQAWQVFLEDCYDAEFLKVLSDRVEEKYQKEVCLPKTKDHFTAFELTSPEAVKVVILGQDPYPTPGNAHGLSFSVPDGVKIPASLKNIFFKIAQDFGTEIPNSGNLSRWAAQGVLLLNTVLTVSSGKAGSHRKLGWEIFTARLIEHLAEKKSNIIFLLWGNDAKKYAKYITAERHCILEGIHPSPLSVNKNKAAWYKADFFKQANAYLAKHHKTPIHW
ncbi:MAG: uracil-DNA glycosylase [Flavobacteriaceae bacterium]|nr:uracil-DNA glycosylase [Flavobacteriaceae bacterium]